MFEWIDKINERDLSIFCLLTSITVAHMFENGVFIILATFLMFTCFLFIRIVDYYLPDKIEYENEDNNMPIFYVMDRRILNDADTHQFTLIDFTKDMKQFRKYSHTKAQVGDLLPFIIPGYDHVGGHDDDLSFFIWFPDRGYTYMLCDHDDLDTVFHFNETYLNSYNECNTYFFDYTHRREVIIYNIIKMRNLTHFSIKDDIYNEIDNKISLMDQSALRARSP